MTLMAFGYPLVLAIALLVLAGKVTENPASMIWYLLYPFRGTTEPPKLDVKHPLRHNFTRYGTNAAKHPVITLLISLAVASILIYPFPFLYTNNFTNGASNLPHHVWTSAQPFEGGGNTRPDVVMRSIWVHGSYMKALDSDVLKTALEIQNELLGPTTDFNPRRPVDEPLPDPIPIDMTADTRDRFHAINGMSNSSWFFHSPLQYWSCDQNRIDGDKDIIKTVNEGAKQATSVNVTLRHSIVFSGKRFEDHRLVAADALVITLVHMIDSPVGRQWERRGEEIARRGSDKWKIIPPDDTSAASTLYEFRFQPLSIQDDLFLVLIYAVLSAYFFINLLKMRALKSRLGLIFAALTQIAVSTMSSFTICAILKIDLSKIPREFYPLVIAALGTQNICTLINTVIMTPSDRPTATRMGDALGQNGHVALASLAQNITILYMLSTVVYPPISAFATFVALALILDYFYLLTFFTAVLSIDVRRTELTDSLSRIQTTRNDRDSPELQQRKTWFDAILRGEAPASTRIAGTILMIGFVVIAQWHFFENESLFGTVQRLLKLITSQTSSPRQNSTALLSVDINQARTPTAWLRLQDHETAHEMIQVIKPNANRIISRVYNPVIFVLNGADRNATRFGVRPFLPAAYDFARNQFGVLLTVVVFLLAAVSLIMNWLLWDESPDIDDVERPEDDPLLSVKTLSHGHFLDIVLMKASNDGVIATAGLDRCIHVWDIRKGTFSYIVHDPDSEIDPFPVLAMAIDSDSNWLAILSAKDKVMLWNIPERRWGPVMDVEMKNRTPAAFLFGYDKSELIDPLLVARHNGVMTELHMEANESKQMRICHSPLVCVRPHFEKPSPQYPHPPPRIVTSSRKGCVHVASQMDEGWVSEGLEIPEIPDDKEIRSIVPLPALSSFLAVREHTVDLVDIFTHKVTHTFPTKSMAPDSLRCFHSTRRRPQCGSVGLASLALAYTCIETGSCILQSYLPQRDGDTICFRDPWTPGSKTCCLWGETVEKTFEIENPGQWQALQVGYIVGIRTREAAVKVTEAMNGHTSIPGLRHRGGLPRAFSKRADIHPVSDDDVWEVWSISAKGEKYSAPLSDDNYGRGHLLVSGLGPIERVGKRTIAVALGNVVKIVTIGNDKFDDTREEADDAAFVGMASSRKKKAGALARKRTT
ncbi:WD40 repeat-like protein [Glarea lozoyensis ATCC 20868]|uniref:Sterol regulatory element-binding protein cleavage-activating protein n=1 Tax=Glarea lozoyensis (strain ATCC 20868 / MF5171) TaxID=1116229 RepID=S3DUN3_GLAL2|nr:WD40 repeat-like protein [Glarea lozoyensis ATCC 20868]EPE30138.1 WD40 repeat-like protein [Glarea lozoyensis ATCC 20868]